MPNIGYKFSEISKSKMREAWRRRKLLGYQQFAVLTVDEQKVREEAKNQGQRYYFFPRQCKRGHVSKRFVKSTSCSKCSQARANRRWQQRYQGNEPELLLYKSARQRSRKEESTFTITKDDIKRVWPTDGRCPVLGIILHPHDKTQDDSPSLDRINPYEGYVAENIVVMSHLANKIKVAITDPTFFERLADWLSAPTGITPNGGTAHICIKYKSRCPCYRMWYSAKRRSVIDNLSFDITPEYIASIWPTDNCCPVIGVRLEGNVTKGPCTTSPTLDRIKPELGYTKGNVAIISYVANRSKLNVTDPEVFRKMAAWLRKVTHV